MQLIFRTTILFALLCTFSNANAQSLLNRLEFGLHAGTLIYQGDLTPSRFGSYRTPGWQLGASASMPLNHFLAVRANLMYGRMRGDDAAYAHPDWRQHRNFNFNSRVLEVSGLAVWNILGDPQHRTGLSPYIFSGLGFSFVKVNRDASDLDRDYFPAESGVQSGLDADLAHSTPRAVFAFPVGVGVRYPLTERLSLNAETSYRITFNDYLDGFSQSGNPDMKDNYHSISIGIFYRFRGNNSVKCPPVQ